MKKWKIVKRKDGNGRRRRSRKWKFQNFELFQSMFTEYITVIIF